MSVSLYMDQHIPGPATRELRRRGVDVLTTQEDGPQRTSDELLLARTTELGRVVVTEDYGFRELAFEWQRAGKEFAGLVFSYPKQTTVGELVRDLDFLSQVSDTDEWRNQVLSIPL